MILGFPANLSQHTYRLICIVRNNLFFNTYLYEHTTCLLIQFIECSFHVLYNIIQLLLNFFTQIFPKSGQFHSSD